VVAVAQSGSQADGAMESMTEILRSVDPRGLLVLTDRESAFTDRWRSGGAEVLVRPWLRRAARAGRPRRFSRPRQALRLGWTNLLAYRFFRRLQAPVIHFTDARVFSRIGLGAKLAGMAATLDVRLLNPPVAIERMALIACDRVVALSDDMAGRLRTLRGIPGLAAKLVVITSGADRDRIEAARSVSRADWRRRLGVDESAVAIGVVGHVSARKQQVELMRRALPAVDAAGDWRVYFLGNVLDPSGPYGERFREALTDSPVADRMSYPGFTREIFGWYRALDLVVVASTDEGLARAMIEAVSSGTPVVSFDVCSARELLDEGCGVVVAGQDFAALAGVMSELIDDAERREAMGAIGARIGERRFDSRLTGRRYDELYSSLRSDHARAAASDRRCTT
jgi:glycosyltransferase involved in cell wall biosynthesis